MLTLPAPAKLNLFLHITGRRDDGYHELQTVFQLLDYGDTLTFSPAAGQAFSFSCTEASLTGPDNLVVRAASLLLPRRRNDSNWHIHLDKRLPAGGGLGGGSSDAATALLALNRLWDCDLTIPALRALGASLGADVPVFIAGFSAWAEGIGEKLQKLEMPQRWYLVVTPPCRADTGQIFGHPQLTRHSAPIRIPAFPFSGTRNDCEKVALCLYPPISEALLWLENFAEEGLEARMTGTGASVFIPARDEASARSMLAQLPGQFSGFVARGVNDSPLHRLLDAHAGTPG